MALYSLHAQFWRDLEDDSEMHKQEQVPWWDPAQWVGVLQADCGRSKKHVKEPRRDGQSDHKANIGKDFELGLANGESWRFLCVIVGWVLVPKEIQDKWLTVVPISISKHGFSQHLKYPVPITESMPAGILALIIPPPTLNISSSWASLATPASHFYITPPFQLCTLLPLSPGPLFCLPLFFPPLPHGLVQSTALLPCSGLF